MSALLATMLAVGLTAQAPAAAPAAPPTAGPVRRPASDATPATAPPARPPAPTVAERKAAAQKAYREGQRLYDKSRYAAATAALLRALRHWPYREIHFNLALCYREQRSYARAYHHLRRYLKGASLKERRAVPRALRRLRQRVGLVVVHSNDYRAEIWIGGRSAGRGRVERVMKPGQVVVEIKRDGTLLKTRELDVPRGGTATWDVSLGRVVMDTPRRPSRRRLLHWHYPVIAAAVAGAATLAAIGFGARTAALHREFDRDPTWSTRDQGLRFQTLTNVMWGLAGVAAVSTAVLAIFTRWRREKPSTRIVPVVTPTGIAVTGSW